jgi:ABC-2 type transport system ATP-binding protein
MPGLALEIDSVVKSYRTGFLHLQRRRVLDQLSLSVERGEAFGCLGPNGSGKTTTIKVLMGSVFADSGSVTILGHPLADSEWRRRTGYLPEHPYFYDYLTPLEYLGFVGKLFDIPAPRSRERARELLSRVGLSRHETLPMRRFSKGMLQRLGLAQALMNDPELIVLDEPMSGLDPIGRRLARDLIVEFKQAGKTVFFSTHILSDAESLCDRVALIRRGRVVESGRIEDILRLDVAHMEVLITNIAGDMVGSLPPGVREATPVGERWRVHVDEGALGALISAVEKLGGRVLSVLPVRQTLEEHFFEEMGGARLAARWELPE